MPTDTEVEEKLRKLEAEVRASRSASPPARTAPTAPVPSAPPAPRPAARPARDATSPSPAPGFLRRLWGRQTWKTQALLVGGALLGGAAALWLVGKLVKLAFAVGVAGAVIYGVWWLVRRRR